MVAPDQRDHGGGNYTHYHFCNLHSCPQNLKETGEYISSGPNAVVHYNEY